MKYVDATDIPLSVPDGTVSGSPVVVGDLPAVALIDKQSDGKATCKTNGAFDFPVKGVGTSGNAAVNEGDILHLQSNGDINKNTGAGKRFGYALAGVGSGATATISVKIGY